MQQNDKPIAESTELLVVGCCGVRYQVKDVQRAIAFYTETLGFQPDMKAPPAFGQVSVPGLKLILSGPRASESRPMPACIQQERSPQVRTSCTA